ncbi:hypothetical protein M3Y95_00782200 [Aphelenchoides besseyi]|nr:hypothetical protein M3Y95_00782200 [Aphelenchoides besseyi]
MVCCGHWAVGIGLFALMALVVGDDGWGPTAKPDYIKDPQCLPVKENDFKEYMELWTYENNYNLKAFFKSTFGETDIYVIALSDENDDASIPISIYGEDKYIYYTMKWYDPQKQIKSMWFVLISPVRGYQWKTMRYEYNDTDPNINVIEGRKFHFAFYHYIFVNSTHFFDAKKVSDYIWANNATHDVVNALLELSSDIFPDLQYISNIPNILMTPFIKKQVMQKCNKKYCVLNMDHPGSGAIWASDKEHYILYKNSVFLIANEVRGSNEIYYTLKHAATGQCYYFPDNLKTFTPRDQGLTLLDLRKNLSNASG